MSNGFSVALASAMALLLVGCVTTQQNAEDPPIFGRVDCLRAAEHPELTPEFEQAKAICVNRAQADGLAGTANMPSGYGLSGGIAASLNQGMTAAAIQKKSLEACMAERGYLLKRRSEHEAMCAAAEPKPKGPAKDK